MRLGAVVLLVVGVRQIVHQPVVGLLLSLWFVEVVERFVRLLDGAKWALDLALGAGSHRVPSLPAGRWVCQAMPNASITFWKTRLLATGPLSR